jgi:hypothetical protein
VPLTGCRAKYKELASPILAVCNWEGTACIRLPRTFSVMMFMLGSVLVKNIQVTEQQRDQDDLHAYTYKKEKPYRLSKKP